MNIHYCMRDNGDGSCSVVWFKDEDAEWLADFLVSDEACNDFFPSEGDFQTITLPDGIDLSTTGIRFSSRAQYEV